MLFRFYKFLLIFFSDELDKEKSKTLQTLQEKETQMEEKVGEHIAAIEKDQETNIQNLQKGIFFFFNNGTLLLYVHFLLRVNMNF